MLKSKSRVFNFQNILGKRFSFEHGLFREVWFVWSKSYFSWYVIWKFPIDFPPAFSEDRFDMNSLPSDHESIFQLAYGRYIPQMVKDRFRLDRYAGLCCGFLWGNEKWFTQEKITRNSVIAVDDTLCVFYQTPRYLFWGKGEGVGRALFVCVVMCRCSTFERFL